MPEGGRLQTQQALRTASSSDGDGLGDFRRRFVRRLALEIMTETVQVARVQELHLEKVAGTLDLDPQPTIVAGTSRP